MKISALTKTILFTVLMVSTLHVKGQEKKYTSLFWEITSPEMKNPSYLYGTMHVSRKVAFHLSDTFFIAIKNCDVIGLETNPADWMDDILASDYMDKYMPVYESSSFSGNRGFYKAAVGLSLPENEDFEWLLRGKHSMTNFMLYRKSSRGDDYEENTFLDLFIFQAGKKYGKEVTNLEGFETSRKMVEKAYEDDGEEEDEEEEKIRFRTIKKMGGRRSLYKLIEDSYRKGDLDMLDSVDHLLNANKRYWKYMIEERNRVMMNNMDSIISSGKSLFTGIGAAHLPGDMGVINMLREKGYTVRPIERIITNKSRKLKDKLEKKVIPLNYATRWSADSSFQVDLPGKLYETPTPSYKIEYFYPEMINGGYYSIVRLKTYSLLFNQSADALIEKIDSLLFENIPGKILTKKRIEKSGYPGFDITNKTSRGDIERYQIFITPLEVFYLKMHGTGNFVKTSTSDKFFNSFKFHLDKKSSWNTYTPENNVFSVNMPSYILNERGVAFKGMKLPEKHIQAIDKKDNSYYIVIQASLHEWDYIEEDTFELNMLINRFNESIEYEVEEIKQTSFGEYPAIEAKLKHEEYGTIFLKGIIKGPDYFLLASKSSSDQRNNTFFNSFQFNTPKYALDFDNYVDSSMYFTVKTFINSKNKYRKKIKKRSRYRSINNKDKIDKSYQEKKLYKIFYAPETNEEISVRYRKFNKYYDAEDTLEFWQDQVRNVAKSNSLVVKDSIMSLGDETTTLDLLLIDTNSTRAIKYKFVLKSGVLYSIKATTDTIGDHSSFVNTFFETFQPSDTIIGESIFKRKSGLLISDLTSNDTTLVKQATRSLSYKSFDDEYVDTLIRLFEEFQFEFEEPEDVREYKLDLIEEIGFRENDKIASWLNKKYDTYTDSVSYQLEIIRALANQETKESYIYLKNIFTDNPPLTDGDSKVKRIFRALNDSLELSQLLYPNIMDLTRYLEFRGNIYELLVEITDSTDANISLYEKEIKNIYRDAHYELKKQFEKDENKGSNKYRWRRYSYKKNKGNEDLEILLKLLLPQYTTPKIKPLFDKALQSSNDHFTVNLRLEMLKNDIAIADSNWAQYAKNLNTRTVFYKSLKEIDRLDLFDSTYKNQKAMTKSILFDDWYQDESDSIVFIKKHLISTKKGKGYIYFYKSKREDDSDWELSYVGLQPVDSSKISLSTYIQEDGIEFYDDEELEEKIEEALKEAKLEGRERASSGRNRYYSSYFWF